MVRIKGRDQFADKLLDQTERDAMTILLTDYDFGKSVAEVDAEVVIKSYQEKLGRDSASEYQDAKLKLRDAIAEWLEVLGA